MKTYLAHLEVKRSGQHTYQQLEVFALSREEAIQKLTHESSHLTGWGLIHRIIEVEEIRNEE